MVTCIQEGVLICGWGSTLISDLNSLSLYYNVLPSLRGLSSLRYVTLMRYITSNLLVKLTRIRWPNMNAQNPAWTERCGV